MLGGEGRYTQGEMKDASAGARWGATCTLPAPLSCSFPCPPSPGPLHQTWHFMLPCLSPLPLVWTESVYFSSSLLPSPSSFWTQDECQAKRLLAPISGDVPKASNGLGRHSDESDTVNCPFRDPKSMGDHVTLPSGCSVEGTGHGVPTLPGDLGWRSRPGSVPLCTHGPASCPLPAGIGTLGNRARSQPQPQLLCLVPAMPSLIPAGGCSGGVGARVEAPRGEGGGQQSEGEGTTVAPVSREPPRGTWVKGTGVCFPHQHSLAGRSFPCSGRTPSPAKVGWLARERIAVPWPCPGSASTRGSPTAAGGGCRCQGAITL